MEPKRGKLKVILIFSCLLIILIGGVLYASAKGGKNKPDVPSGKNKPSSQTSSIATSAEIALNPDSGTYQVGETFVADITIDTAGKAIDGVDIRYLNYNPRALEVQDADPGIEGVQIRPGSLFASYMANKVDSEKGLIAITGITNPGTEGFSGAGVFASIDFKILAADAVTEVNFDFTPELSTDTNMAEHVTSKDSLSVVKNGHFVLTSVSGSPTVDIQANQKNEPLSINPGKTATLSWSSNFAESCMASGSWSGEKPTSGSEETSPLGEQENYILSCTNAQGTATDNVQVNIRLPQNQ